MQYERIREGKFLSRPNRFIAWVELNGEPVRCHVKNTGRCRELLLPGVTVYLQENRSPERKTAFDLISVRKDSRLINMDSQAPNRAAREWIAAGGLLAPGEELLLLRPECTYGHSRFDFYFETSRGKFFLEVKGVTLEENGVVLFPDAPTERGIKHVEELCHCLQDGYGAYLLFVIQMNNVRCFRPNMQTHPAFGMALLSAQKQGVRILARDCAITESSMEIRDPVAVELPTEILPLK